MQKKSNVILRLVVLALILFVVNMISSKLYFRLDFTEDQRYTLSRATKDILHDLDDVVTVKAYFSEDLPAQLLNNRQDFEDLLLEYENRSGGNVVYEFVSPNDDEEIEGEAQQYGIQPLVINVTEKDQVQQLKAYMGAVLMMGDRREVIAVVQPGVNMEYDLTTSIKKLSVVDKPKVAILQGHGEPSLQGLVQLSGQLSVLYDLEPLDLKQKSEVPGYIKTLAIIHPKDTISAEEFARIDAYMAQGGNVFVAYSNMNGDLQSGYLSKGTSIGLQEWLRNKDVQMGDQFVVDANSGSVTVQQQNGMFNFRSQIKFPYFPMLSEFPDHAITKGLEGIMLPFVSALSYIGRDSVTQYSPLLMTSERSGLATTPAGVSIDKRWTEADFNHGSQTLALALDGPLVGNQRAKLVVVSNGQFIVNGNPPQQISPDNINFASNAIDWLSDDTGLIDLRTKGVTSRPIDQLEDGEREIIKYINVLVPILLVLVYALIRKQRYASKKQRWMQGNYK
ncbi:GldG family protein [Reichenbachiella agarivorans]|uniref:GldG family protein n=1 Tax=Reichenbachiella agarivorans TaxID=2979464 RepID=A0ABY6CNQ4_9BACT|nr:GldG family protein [Reichenbachiella agarivorans]UXP31394.1 GldG family protein [Reichenbachiella agarivorans]